MSCSTKLRLLEGRIFQSPIYHFVPIISHDIPCLLVKYPICCLNRLVKSIIWISMRLLDLVAKSHTFDSIKSTSLMVKSPLADGD